MLRTNSKAARQNIMEYIKDDLDYLEERRQYDIEEGAPVYNLDEDAAICAMIWDIFQDEKGYEIKRSRGPVYNVFEDWAQGLALGGLFLYYYNRSAVDDLGAILEETEEEKAKFTEQEAEERLTRLIYREITARKEKASAPEYIDTEEEEEEGENATA